MGLSSGVMETLKVLLGVVIACVITPLGVYLLDKLSDKIHNIIRVKK